MSARMSGQKVLKRLNEAGYAAYFVGGMVRDTLLGRDVYDADITTEATPDEVFDLFEKTFATGLQHGTVTVLMDDENVEVTTFRLDGDYLDNRRPEGVVFTRSLSDDLARRDFTINAMAQELDETIIDPFNGQTDLEAGMVRAVGDPKKRFGEDALRILRGIRFVAKLGFDIEEETLNAMKECRHLLANLSLERIRKEFEGILDHDAHREKALALIVGQGIFEYIPFFSVLVKFKNLDRIKNIVTLFAVAAFELQNPKGFLSEFPLTKEEKKTIQALLAMRDKLIDECLILYHFGAEVYKQRYLLTCFYQNENYEYQLPTMIINSRAELAIQPKEVIKESGNAPGAWIGRLFTEIEEAVVLGKIENNRNELVRFIKERGIFDEKEN